MMIGVVAVVSKPVGRRVRHVKRQCVAPLIDSRFESRHRAMHVAVAHASTDTERSSCGAEHTPISDLFPATTKNSINISKNMLPLTSSEPQATDPHLRHICRISVSSSQHEVFKTIAK